MYRSVLAAVNEHVNSEIAARYALDLAARAKARVFICSIAEKGIGGKEFRLAEEAVKRLSARAHERGLPSDCVLETGDPFERIDRIVRSEGIDVLFAATRHEDVQRRFYTRTTARRLLRGMRCSVALVRVVHLGRTHPKELLVPLKERIDHVPERAYFTAMLAGAFDATVHLFHVARPIRSFLRGETGLPTLEHGRPVPPDVARFIDHLEGYGVAHEDRRAPGAEGRSITIEAASRRRDLIIMGASVRGFLGTVLRGDPVEYVLRETPCNMIILKPGH